MQNRSYWPPSSKDVAGMRLLKALEESKERQAIIKELNTDIGLDLAIFETDVGKGMLAMVAFKLAPDKPQDLLMLKAFAESGLDPNNILHWHELLSVFCKVHFGHVESGRKKEWEGERYVKLYFRSEQVAREGTKGDLKIAEKLKKKYSADYTDQSKDTLRKILPKARSYFKDIFGGPYPGNYILNMLTRDAAKKGQDLSPLTKDIATRIEVFIKREKLK